MSWLSGTVADWVNEAIIGFAITVINGFLSALKLFLASWAVKDTVNIRTGEIVEGGDESSQSISVFMQDVMNPIVAVIAICGILVAAIRLAWMRRVDPLGSTMTGLVTLVITTVLGIAIAATLIDLSDSISNRFIDDMISSPALDPDDSAAENALQILAYSFFITIVALIGTLFVFAQMAFMLFRDASLLILAGVLPLAASGKLIPGTKWFEKITGWMLALIFYKPCAVMVMWVGFRLLEGGAPPVEDGSAGADTLGFDTSDVEGEATVMDLVNTAYTMTMGVIVLGLALLAMPVMVKLFDFTVGHVGGLSNPAPAIAGAAAAGTLAYLLWPTSRGAPGPRDRGAVRVQPAVGPDLSGVWLSGSF